jgi:hypothetical protein
MSETYDSTKDTQMHIDYVRHFMKDIFFNWMSRMEAHDSSKLYEPEKSMYDEFTPKLRSMTYGSDEYKQTLKLMGTELEHHYALNTHHPEHYTLGINGMSLLDVMEMLADWKAATLRHDDGDIQKSFEINKKRFVISDQLVEILQNTLKELGW